MSDELLFIKQSTVSGIADAIREKTGETGNINPANFASKISAIETGGSSGGGSSLPAGGYWKPWDVRTPNTKVGKHFVLNNELYLHQSTSTSYVYPIYKYENGAYTIVVADTYDNATYGWNLTPAYRAIEFNGKVHFMGDSMTRHSTWDGATEYANLNALPFSITNNGVCVYQGDLYISNTSGSSDYGIYKWIEATDTWELVWNPFSTNCYIFSDGNTLFAAKNSAIYADSIYKLNNGEFELVCDSLPSSPFGGPGGIVFNGNLYFEGYVSGAFNTIYKLTDSGVIELCKSPYSFSSAHFLIYDNHINVSGGSGCYNMCLALHEIED